MNTLMKQIAVQAEKTVKSKYPNDPMNIGVARMMTVFAELIVKECSEQAISIGRYNTRSGITPDLAFAIAVGLKKHFGVE